MAIYESADAAARLMSVEDSDESLDNMNPIFGVDEAPDLSFKDAMQKVNVRRKKNYSCCATLRPQPALTTRSHRQYGVQYRR